MKKDVFRFLVSLLSVGAMLFILDRVGARVMWWVNQHTHDVSGPKIRMMTDSVDADFVMMGTSRCNSHYVPAILADSLRLTVYNGGVDASGCIFAHYFLLQQLLRHHSPKMVGLDVLPNDYMVNPSSFNTMGFFAPYIGRSKEADEVFHEAGTYWYYQISHLYRYNSKAVSNLAGLLVNRQNHVDRGYLPGPPPPIFPDRLRTDVPDVLEVDSLKINYLEKFITQCQQRGILVFFVVSPSYTKVSPGLYDPLKDVAHRHGIPFFDYHTARLFHDHPDYFRDHNHLWDRGARLYSSRFAHDLKLWWERQNDANHSQADSGPTS